MNRKIILFSIAIFVGLFAVEIVYLFLVSQPNDFDINYSDYAFDYIIPRPWYSQVEEIARYDFVDSISPFYIYRTSYNEKNKVNFDLYLIDNQDVENLIDDGFCIVDYDFAKIAGVKVGDTIAFKVFDTIQTKTIKAVLSRYPFSSRPSVFSNLTKTDELLLQSNIDQLSYSGAYVKANDFEEADKYFYYEYYPLGKVGEESWYESSEAYKYMLSSITATSVPNEIISVESARINQSQSRIDYYKERSRNFIISCLLIGLLFFLSWVGVLQLNKRKDENKIVLGCKISLLLRDYFASYFVFLIIASIGSFLYAKSYSFKYSIIFEVFIDLCVITLCLLTQKRFCKKTSHLEKITFDSVERNEKAVEQVDSCSEKDNGNNL